MLFAVEFASFLLQLLRLELKLSSVLLGAALCLGHRGLAQDHRLGGKLWLGRELLHGLKQLLDQRDDLREGLLAVELDVLRRDGEHLVDLCRQLLVLVLLFGQRLVATGLGDVAVHAVQVPHHHVLLDVLQATGQVERCHDRVATERRVQGEVQVALDVRQVILLQIREGILAQRHSDVLVRWCALLGSRGVLEQLVDARDLQLLQEALLDGLAVVQVRCFVSTGQHSLHLGHALRLGEDVGVRHRNHVSRAAEVLWLDLQISNDLTLALVFQVPAVQAAKDLEHSGLRVVQTGVDGGEHRSTLLDQRLSRTHWGVGVDVSDLLFSGGDHATSRFVEVAHQLKQHRRGWVERHGHGDLLDVVHTGSAFDLHDLGDVHLLALAADLGPLELEHGRGVVDVCAVEQSTDAASQSRRQAADQVRQADSVSATPRDELELHDPVQLGHGLVAVFPVAVQAHNLVLQLVDHHDVRGHLALGLVVVLQLQVAVDVIDSALTVLVVLILAAFDLVVGLLGCGLVRLHGCPDDLDVTVQARADAALELPLGDDVDLSRTLGGVEVGGRERDDDPVNRQELSAGALLLLVVPELHVL